MSILRNSLRQKFAQIPNELITDTRLSNGAFRVAAYLYSRPDNWNVNNKDVQAQLGINDRGTLAKYWNELIEFGWIARELKPHDENGHFGGYDYTLLMSSTVAGKTLHGGDEPCREKPAVEETRSGKNPTHNNKEDLSNTEIKTNTEGETPAPKNELPIEEQRILETCQRVYAYFKEFPAMVQKCKEATKEPSTSNKDIMVEIEAWVRYHSNEFHFLSTIEKNISKSFIPWMQKRPQFAPKAKPNFQPNQPEKPQVYVAPKNEHFARHGFSQQIDSLAANAAQKMRV